MKKILMVLLLTTLFQGFAMANEYEVEEQETYLDIAINSLEETTSLSKEEIEDFFYIYDNFGWTEALKAYQIQKEIRFDDWEIKLYYDYCSYYDNKTISLYMLETLRKKEYLNTTEEGNWWE